MQHPSLFFWTLVNRNEVPIKIKMNKKNTHTTDRQTMLFSATQTRKTEDLIRLSFNSKPLIISINNKLNNEPTPDSLKQGYIVGSQSAKFFITF